MSSVFATLPEHILKDASEWGDEFVWRRSDTQHLRPAWIGDWRAGDDPGLPFLVGSPYGENAQRADIRRRLGKRVIRLQARSRRPGREGMRHRTRVRRLLSYEARRALRAALAPRRAVIATELRNTTRTRRASNRVSVDPAEAPKKRRALRSFRDSYIGLCI